MSLPIVISIMTTEDSAAPPTTTSATGLMVKIFLGCLSIPLIAALAGFWYFGISAHYADATRMPHGLLGDTYRKLTPPTAVDLTLQRDVLDHRSVYTVTQADLETYLKGYFGSGYEEPSPVDRGSFEAQYSRLGWTWVSGMVEYTCIPGNGAVSSYYHDPSTGLTYQDSAHW